MLSGVKVKNSLTEANVDTKNIKHTEIGEEMLGWLHKFEEIEEKNKCLRVQFLDWLSDKFLDWSNKCHVMSVKIDSPCVIKVEPRKREESRDAKERKEIARLKELLAKADARYEILYDKHTELSKDLVDQVAKILEKEEK